MDDKEAKRLRKGIITIHTTMIPLEDVFQTYGVRGKVHKCHVPTRGENKNCLIMVWED